MPESEMNEGIPDALNVRAIRQLVRLMKRYDLTAIDFAEDGTQIRLRRRGPDAGVTYGPPPVASSPVIAHHHQPSPAPAVAAPVTPVSPAGIVIQSPMVGTFYSSSSPDTPPFVNLGSTVRPDMTVCIIEAMKVFTDIPAGVSGTITEILVKSGQPVEFDQPMFRVSTD